MVCSLPAIVLLGITHLATCTSPNQSPESNPEEGRSISANNVEFPSLLSTLHKRNDISRIDNGLLSFSPQNYPYPADGSLDNVATSERELSQKINYPGETRDTPLWFNSHFFYGDSNGLSQNEGNDGSSSLMSKRRAKELMDKRRLQMQGPGLMRSGQKGLLGYSGNRNKGLVLSIDLGIKALRDAIYHAKVRQQNRKMQAQTQRNMKLLHNIGKRRAVMKEQF